MTATTTRRRFIAIAAGTAAAAVFPFAGHAAAAGPPVRRWKGVALGAAAEILLPEPGAAAALAACRAEIARLEAVFSLYRRDSALVRLNRAGVLEAPPPELTALVARALALSKASGGVFDPTVQPLWALYADHFRASGADPVGPPADAVAAARQRVDWRAVRVDTGRIAFTRPGMALTLNGIAQGYVTDRVADLLRGSGYGSVLVSLGETRAVGAHPAGRPWSVTPGPGRPTLPLADGALATSAGAASPFDAAGRHTHLLDPRTGAAGARWQAVTVAAPTATEADGLSTALSFLDAAAARALFADSAAGRAWLVDGAGDATVL